MGQLEQLYEAQNQDLGEIQARCPVTARPALSGLSMLRLRAIVDSVTEALPPLLELGQVGVAAEWARGGALHNERVRGG